MENYKLVIFDLDGTLIDSIADYAEATNLLLKKYDCPEVSVEEVTRRIGYGLRQYIVELFQDSPHTEEIIDQFFSYYENACLNSTYLYPGVQKFLSEFEGKTAVVTNKMESQAKKILQHLLPDHDFVEIFGADSFPERKPHPRPLLETMKLAQCRPEETLMVGDSSPDILASRAADVDCVAVTFGYTEKSEINKLAPMAVIDHFSELDNHVFSHQQALDVTCALILNGDKVLLAQKPSDHPQFPGLWEFPGGKTESGESARQGLGREIKEELNCEVSVEEKPLSITEHNYKNQKVRLSSFVCQIQQGEPSASEHRAIKWVDVKKIHSIPLVPADIEVARHLLSYYAMHNGSN